MNGSFSNLQEGVTKGTDIQNEVEKTAALTDSQQDALSLPKWLKYIISPKSHELTVFGHMLLAIGFVGFLGALNVAMLLYGTSLRRDWLPPQAMPEDVEQRLGAVQATEAEKLRMKDQLQQVLWRINVHGKVMGLFYCLNFVSLTTLCIGAGTGTISLFFISKHGWERINNAVITLFILSTGAIFIHSNLMLMMRYQDNITLNRQLFETYSDAKHSILSYWATQATSPDGLTAAEFIQEIDTLLFEFNDIALTFDHDQAAILRRSFDLIGTQETIDLPASDSETPVQP